MKNEFYPKNVNSNIFCYRKKLIQEEFTPCYAYDQSENEVVDGILYPNGTNSVDLMHVHASPPVQRVSI